MMRPPAGLDSRRVFTGTLSGPAGSLSGTIQLHVPIPGRWAIVGFYSSEPIYGAELVVSGQPWPEPLVTSSGVSPVCIPLRYDVAHTVPLVVSSANAGAAVAAGLAVIVDLIDGSEKC